MTSINLLNLAKIGQLDLIPLSLELMGRMLATAKQRLRDAEFIQKTLSDYDGELVSGAALKECLSQAKTALLLIEGVMSLRSDPS